MHVLQGSFGGRRDINHMGTNSRCLSVFLLSFNHAKLAANQRWQSVENPDFSISYRNYSTHPPDSLHNVCHTISLYTCICFIIDYHMIQAFSSNSRIHSQSPFAFSLQRVTLLSPQETANTLPDKDQLTRQTTSGNFCPRLFLAHLDVGVSWVQINTDLS